MAELKTKVNDASVTDFLNSIEDEQRRADCYVLLDLLRAVTAAEPKMWGDAIVGFGDYHYKYASGREADWFIAGFSPRVCSRARKAMQQICGPASLPLDLGGGGLFQSGS